MVRTKLRGKKSSIKKNNSFIRPIKFSDTDSAQSPASSICSSQGTTQELGILLDTEYDSLAAFLLAFNDFYEKEVEHVKNKYEETKENIEKYFSELLNTLPESYLTPNICSHLDNIDADTLKRLNPFAVPNLKPKLKLQTSKEESSDFKKPRTPRRTSKRISRKRSLSAPTLRALPPASGFKTPLNSCRQQMAALKTITPKVCNTPVSVMRRPQHGEVAFSTSGSPLLIGPVSREDIPTVSVPLQDGRVFSILPDPGMPPPDLPDFDEETKKYLKTLREHLAMLSQSP